MEAKVTRHISKDNAIWVNTTNEQKARELAESFLKELECSEYTYKVRICEVWKKDPSFMKIMYGRYDKPGSKFSIQKEKENNQVYALTIVFKGYGKEKTSYYLDKLSVLEKIITTNVFFRLYHVAAIDIGEGETFFHHSVDRDHDDAVLEYKYHFIRVS